MRFFSRFIAVIVMFTFFLSLSGCITDSASSITGEITIPAFMFEGKTEDEILRDATDSGFTSCKVNADGSVTYTVTAAKRKELLKEYKAEADAGIHDILDGENACPSFRDITYSDDLSSFDVFVDADSFTLWDQLYAYALYAYGLYYQYFSGINPEMVDVAVRFIDDETKEELQTVTYREFINRQSENITSKNEEAEVHSSVSTKKTIITTSSATTSVSSTTTTVVTTAASTSTVKSTISTAKSDKNIIPVLDVPIEINEFIFYIPSVWEKEVQENDLLFYQDVENCRIGSASISTTDAGGAITDEIADQLAEFVLSYLSDYDIDYIEEPFIFDHEGHKGVRFIGRLLDNTGYESCIFIFGDRYYLSATIILRNVNDDECKTFVDDFTRKIDILE